MNKQEVYELIARWSKTAAQFVGDGVSQVLKDPSGHGSFVCAWLLLGLLTFLVLAIGGHRATRQGPSLNGAIILAWPIPLFAVFLHAAWIAFTFFFWKLWREE
jgi:hypothetical protein